MTTLPRAGLPLAIAVTAGIGGAGVVAPQTLAPGQSATPEPVKTPPLKASGPAHVPAPMPEGQP
ncbi:hypothetical protein [Mycobacterium sp. 360MFTsu5.1]|uniref:hypothetical protein n=1 Tax=Mycobacterium sp. 360MFTsu5.1 TaxID=1172186 RepID=UPI0003A5C23E|nr:hypothetical protein [Mycobacterium sp. 360MFTsu5.1]